MSRRHKVMWILKYACLVPVLPFFLGCQEDVTMPNQADFAVPGIGRQELMELSKKKVFFGHQSVGYNIVSGFEDLKQHDDRLGGIHLVRMDHPDAVTAPGIYHASIGANGFPLKKIEAFREWLEAGRRGAQFDIAFFKFCYVDFNRISDPKEIMRAYVEAIERLKAEFPNLDLIHVTVPLQVHRRGIRSFVRNIVRGDLDNVKRDEYNRLLLEKFGEAGSVYDLARVESTRPDGQRSGFNHGGRFYPSLFKGYTTDGGHLNSRGKLAAARELLAVLCRFRSGTVN